MPLAPLNVKGMGEGGGGPLHTLSAALQDALDGLGVVIRDSHHSPSRLHDLLNAPQESDGVILRTQGKGAPSPHPSH